MAYASAFLTDEGKIRNRLATKGAIAALPEAVEILDAEARRLLDLISRLKAARLAESSAAILTLGAEMIERYARLKESHAALDYEDLVLAARRLLETPGIAPWVLFKLDGGIDHILVDEAQDTNPAQWRIIELLAEEFFVGEGARPGPRTVFAVGDVKQSIFSFQGADPEAFVAMRRHFDRRLASLGSVLEEVPLTISFRSTEAVLAAVDAIFAQAPAQAGVSLDGRPIAHQAARLGQAGHVELWPLAEPQPREPDPDWRPPRERRAGDSPRERLAKLIARRIKAMLEQGELLESRGRPVRPGDFLILLRHRDELVDALVRELKGLQVPVAGIDRMRLTEQLAVRDLIAFGQFLLLPEDDFNLAVLLKSPLLGWSEEDLFALAHDRKGSLWEALRGREEFAGSQALLAEFLGKVDYLAPYELYADLLGRQGGRLKLLRRLGPEAGDPIAEFMALALAYCIVMAGLIVATFIDLAHFIIPDEITIGGAVMGFLCSFAVPSLHDVSGSRLKSMGWSLVGIVVGGLIVEMVRQLGKLAFGRMKLALGGETKVFFGEAGVVLPDREIAYEDIFYRKTDAIRFQASRLELADRCYTNVAVALSPLKLTIGAEEFDPEQNLYMEAVTDKMVLPREAMGFGDVKFMAAIGAFLGWQATLFSLVVSSFIGALVGGAMILLHRHKRSAPIPYGPYIAAAAVLWIWAGKDIVVVFRRLVLGEV